MILNQLSSSSSPATSAASASSTSALQSAGLSSASSLNENDFLNMLITELQNQDPTNPLQSTDLAAQLAQFSQVSELQTMNTNIQNSTSANLVLTQSINNTMASTLIGKEIKVNTSTDRLRWHNTGKRRRYVEWKCCRCSSSKLKIPMATWYAQLMHGAKPIGRQHNSMGWQR